jgi:hypothetical protein
MHSVPFKRKLKKLLQEHKPMAVIIGIPSYVIESQQEVVKAK